MRWSVLNPDQILPIPHLAFWLHVKASFSPQNISAASKRAPKWFMIGSMSVQYFSSSLRSKEGAQYYGTFTFWKGELFTSCVAGYFWKYTSFVTCVDSPGYIALHIQIVQAGNRTKKDKWKFCVGGIVYDIMNIAKMWFLTNVSLFFNGFDAFP